MSNASEGMTEGVRRRFADAKYVPHPTPSIQSSHSPILKAIGKDREADQILIYNSVLNKWHTDNLYTHIFALALTIDNFDLDIYDLREDLKLENKEYLSLPSSVPPLRLLPQLPPSPQFTTPSPSSPPPHKHHTNTNIDVEKQNNAISPRIRLQN